jgi:hypothetical protein
MQELSEYYQRVVNTFLSVNYNLPVGGTVGRAFKTSFSGTMTNAYWIVSVDGPASDIRASLILLDSTGDAKLSVEAH